MTVTYKLLPIYFIQSTTNYNQIATDLGTDLLIGPHGAGLMHSVFMRDRWVQGFVLKRLCGVVISAPYDSICTSRSTPLTLSLSLLSHPHSHAPPPPRAGLLEIFIDGSGANR